MVRATFRLAIDPDQGPAPAPIDKNGFGRTIDCMTVDTSRQAPIAKRIAMYSPAVLSRELWAQHGDEIRAITIEAEPRSAEDAKSLLVALSKFAAWRHHHGLAMASLRDHLDDAAINAYAAHVNSTAAAKTAENELGRLRRIHRTLNGLPQTPPPRPSRKRATPYTDEEIANFLAIHHPALSAAVKLALDTGIVVPAAHHHPTGYASTDWEHAKRAARTSGTTLDSYRLHMTWARHQSKRRVSTVELVRAGLGPAALDSIARAADPPTIDQLAAARWAGQ